MAKTIESKQFTLKGRDWLKGLLIAVVTAVLTIVKQTVEAGSLSFNWEAILTATIAAGSAYILKNLLEPSKKVTIHEGGK